jgi:hypothetical protein
MAKLLNLTVSDEVVINKIYYIRKQKVMLDEDPAELEDGTKKNRSGRF